MGKTYSKAELENKAKDTFKDYPKADEVFAAKDGNIFLSKNRADLHAGAEGTVISIQRINTEENENSDDKPANAQELIAAAKTMTQEEAQAALEVEEATEKPRKTVVAAYNERIEELKTKS